MTNQRITIKKNLTKTKTDNMENIIINLLMFSSNADNWMKQIKMFKYH